MIPFHQKWYRLNSCLNCLAGLWTFLHLKDAKILLHIIVLIVRSCFDRMHGLNKLFFALDARALLMFNYDRPSRIFPCILLTGNHMIFLLQFGINQHLLIFSKTTNCTRPTGSCNFVSLWKNLLVLIYTNCTCDYLYKDARKKKKMFLQVKNYSRWTRIALKGKLKEKCALLQRFLMLWEHVSAYEQHTILGAPHVFADFSLILDRTLLHLQATALFTSCYGFLLF